METMKHIAIDRESFVRVGPCVDSSSLLLRITVTDQQQGQVARIMFPTSSQEIPTMALTGNQLCHHFSFEEIQLATEDFDDRLVIGHGGFGKVYKGRIKNGTGTVAAIKRLGSGSAQGASEFWAEVEMLSKLRHCNLVSLIGYCNDYKEMALVYEYIPNGSLEDHLHKHHTPLSWLQRLRICIGAARGLDYLHTGTGTKQGIIHRDVKSSNILLDEDWAAKISDFGLSKISPINQMSTYVNTHIKGTFGYFDPEYFQTGRLTRKSDVYSFGVILLEVLCRRPAVDRSVDEEQWGLVGWAQDCQREGKQKQIIDKELRGQISPKCLNKYVEIVDRCLLTRPKLRITMAEVVVGLQSIFALQEKTDNSMPSAGIIIFGKKLQKFFFSSEEDSDNKNEHACALHPQIANPPRNILGHTRAPHPQIANPPQNILDNKNDHASAPHPRIASSSHNIHFELAASGWPSWLVTVAGEALVGLVPQRADSFEKLDKIGQGSHGIVFKGRDCLTGKIVALKKVRLDHLEPESVKKMAREILTLRRLDHPNVIKLEGLVTSRMSSSLYLVFEYMEHDLAALSAKPCTRFTESQVKCYMHQLLSGLEHCHNCHVLHRDINGSDILINDKGVIKIAGFGSASFFDPNQRQPMTNHKGTLWYRAPELLLGATEYGVGVDLWSAGCILAELLAGKPIMAGRTEIEQLHKIYRLCGSPSDDYWEKCKLPFKTLFKPQQPYKRCLAETFKDFSPSSLSLIEILLSFDPAKRQSAASALRSEFFTTSPDASDFGTSKLLSCEAMKVIHYPRHPPAVSSTVVELTTRVDLVKEQHSQLMEQFHNLD